MTYLQRVDAGHVRRDGAFSHQWLPGRHSGETREARSEGGDGAPVQGAVLELQAAVLYNKLFSFAKPRNRHHTGSATHGILAAANVSHTH